MNDNSLAKTILVVEDESIIAMDIRNSLKRLGYQAPPPVTTAPEAIAMAGELKPDLILMDIFLKGGMDGVEAAVIIKSRYNIPIVYLTANTDEKTFQRAKISEPSGYLLKPFEERELHTTIETALYKHKVEQELHRHRQHLEDLVRERTAELEKTHRALQQSEENYRTIFDSANDAIFVMAADNGAIIDANHKVVELTGYSQEEAGRLTFADLSATTPPFTAAEVRLYFSRAMDGEPQLFEWQIIHSNDFRPIWVEINLKRTPIRGQERLLAVIRDIALRKEAELLLIRAKDEAEAANRLKTQFLANMSHEIRTPMNAVLGLTDIIMKKQVQPSDQRRYLQMIRDAGTTLLSLLNDILDYAKLEAGQFVLENQPFDLEQLVTDTVRCQARQAIGKGVELLCAPLPRLSALLAGDSLRLRQVLLNLLGNAIKFTAKGHILLEALVEEESDRELTIRISVSDTGIGIPADKQAVIFERFSQADPTLTRSYGGTGLGLAIARKVVELMGGRIWLESEEGKGSTFYCTFRFAKSTPFGDGRYPAGRPYQAMDALIIDNLPPRRRITAQLLGELGFTVEETDNEDDGLAALARRATDRRPPALVCLDLAPGAVDTALLELKLTAAAGGSNTSFLLLSPPLPMAPCEQHPWPDNFFCLEKPLSRTKLPALLIQAFPPAP